MVSIRTLFKKTVRRWRRSFWLQRRNGQDTRIKKRTAVPAASYIALLLVLSLVLGGCSYSVGDLDGGTGSAGTYSAADENDGTEEGSSGSGEGSADGNSGGDSSDGGSSSDADNAEAMEGPDVPPDGMRYDEWKGFEYSDETSFSTRSYWGLHLTDNSLPSSRGFVTEPSYLDGTLTFTSAKAEPVGGEMKLRSGGYVDITIESEWTATVTMRVEQEYAYYLWDYLVWDDISPTPCDAYTGTSLLNYSDRDDEDAEENALNVGEGSNSGLVESDVTWNSRIYRLYAGRDSRNASFGGSDIESFGTYETYTQELKELEILTFRVPADYDGLILMIPKDVSDQKSLDIDERGNILNKKDLYADILTDISGAKHSADECYFVKVSDLVEKFQGTESSADSAQASGEDASQTETT